MIDAIRWHGHATFSIEGTPRIMIDPWRVSDDGPPPDVILVSHSDYDHCSPADVQKLRAPHTIVIASADAAAYLDDPVTVLRPWQVINIGRTSIKGVPAYTFDGRHPAHREDLGFVISRDYTDIYYAGDTDFVPELRNIYADIAILPVTTREGTLPLSQAKDLVASLGPRYVIPSHIGNHPSSAGRLAMQAFSRELGALTDIVAPGDVLATR